MKITTAEIPGKGLGVVATEPISAGDVILVEHPLLVHPQASAARSVCSFCLKILNNEGNTSVSCSLCNHARFCNETCAVSAAADPGSHCTLVCRSLQACNVAGLSEEHQSAIHYLTRACSLLIASMSGDTNASARFQQLAELAGRGNAAPNEVMAEAAAVALELHGRVCHALSVAGVSPSSIDVNTVAALLERDAVNGYGIVVPRNLASNEVHPLRGTALYALASRLNHECLPNVARFDDFDAPQDNTALCFRALHALPAGEEVTQSYFPLTWSFEERQQRCKEHYGFNCVCPRCKEEATWGSSENLLAVDGTAAGTAGSTAGGEADPAYIHLFLLKYICPIEECGGTMAPLSSQNDTLQCNVCGNIRTEAEFLEEVERDMQE